MIIVMNLRVLHLILFHEINCDDYFPTTRCIHTKKNCDDNNHCTDDDLLSGFCVNIPICCDDYDMMTLVSQTLDVILLLNLLVMICMSLVLKNFFGRGGVMSYVSSWTWIL